MWSCCGICGSYFVGLPPTVATKSCYSKALTQPSNGKSLSPSARHFQAKMQNFNSMWPFTGECLKMEGNERYEKQSKAFQKTLTHYCQVNVKQSVYSNFSHVHYCCRQLSSREQSKTKNRLKRRTLRVAEPYQQ